MNKIILSIVFTTLLIAYIVIDIAFNDELWDVSKSFAISMQKTIPLFEQLFYEFFSDIVIIPPIAAFYCFVYDDNKLNALLYLGVVITSVTTNEILKNIYHQARPYMIEPEIRSLKCNSDYGKPSGHSQNSIVMLILMPVLLFPSIRQLRRHRIQVDFQDNNEKVEPPTGYTIYTEKNSELGNSQYQVNTNLQSKFKIAMKVILILFILLSIVLTGISRVFLGVHSLGQVLLGWVWGLYITLMYIFVIHASLREYILNLVNPKRSRLEEMNHIIPMAFFLLIVLLGLSLGLLKMNSLYYYDKNDMSKWIARINECKSTHYTKESPQILYNSCFQFTGVGALITGLLVGAVLVQGSYEEGLFNKWKKKLSTLYHLKRFLLLLLPFVILIPFLFISSNSVVLQMICKILPLCFGAGFIVNGAFPYLLRRFNLQIPGDFLFFCQRKQLDDEQSQDSLYQQIKEYNDQYQIKL
ncbi:unnamed protein product (macronuclear) [Paramecium tetraurelia]|uniref:Phosphatidic acid phosphatase type 2/haloperoxidase domain-containing protein n=1 Tax=Paramecium tetraurelia TaxID=5888 RepID=A0BGW0_PARTE|nr:uncharacterized protein GSPATT00028812001 [Paramecium tetraurelia]CAK57777.1 unnamed protein product [Paramecium tetraurelia]|eukprot:XP_001425175.1 hypothetical protein (macronuclear) [Paramecium tetraurelia strain d4-2]